MAKVRVNWGRLPHGSEVKVYCVRNTAHNSLYVLAKDERAAMSIAYTANHIYDPTPTMGGDYSRLAFEVRDPHNDKLTEHWDSITRAVDERLQGTLHFDDGKLAIGDEVIIP